MIVTFLRDTGKICYAVCQAAVIGVAIAVNYADDIYGFEAPKWLSAVGIVFYVAGIICNLTAKNIQKTHEAIQLSKNHGKRHRLKIPKNTTITVEVEP